MTGVASWFGFPSLLSGAERKQLRQTICEGTDRDGLAMALGELDPPREYQQLVRQSDFEHEVDQLIGRALREGWLSQLVAAFVSRTERTDLVAQANGIRDAVAERQKQRGSEPGANSGRLRWIRIAAAIGVLVIFGLVVWLWLWRDPDPNFKVRLQQDDEPVRMRPVFVSPIVAGSEPAERLVGITDNQGEAFFALALGTNRLYRFGVKVDERAECTFPAFSVIEIREVLYELNDTNCRRLPQDVVVRSTAPQLPAGVANVDARLPTNLEARRSRAPLGLPDAPLVVDRRVYTVGFDPSILSPRWVAFNVDTRRTIRLRRGDSRFEFDPDIPQVWQTGEDAYRNNSYDRGHLMRRQDALVGPTEEGARASEREISYYSVTVPQADETNRTTWLAIEQYTTQLSARLGLIHVVAGPVYPDLTRENGAYLTLGRSRTVVPQYLYRILLRRDSNGRWRTLAFLAPNDGSASRNPLQFATSVSQIEQLTGLRFFPDVSPAAAEAFKSNASVSSFETQ